MQPYHTELAPGTANPSTFLRCLGPKPWRTAYVEPVHPAHGRPLRREPVPLPALLPVPGDPQAGARRRARPVLRLARARSASTSTRTTCGSSRTTGSSRRWAPGGSAGRSGSTGWRSRSSRTSSSSAGSSSTSIPAEITYGLERLAMFLQGKRDARSTSSGRRAITWGDVYRESERQWSTYNFEEAPVDVLHAPLRRARGRGRAPRRARPAAARRTTRCSSARTRSTCSTRAARSPSPSARPTSAASATSRATVASLYVEQHRRGREA